MANNQQTPPDRRGSVQKLWDRLTLSWRLMVDRRVELGHKFIPLLAFLYVVSPIDFIPEALFGPLGVFDDIGLFILGLETFIRMAPPEVVREHMNFLKGRFDPQEKPKRRESTSGEVIEGEYRIND